MQSRFVFVECVLLGLSLGCGQTPSISGKVTYNGTPIETGYLTLNPVGKGRAVASPIKYGEYSIAEIDPGTYQALATGSRHIDHYTSSAEAYARAAKEGPQHVSEEANYIAEDAEGNNHTIEITSGHLTLDLSIQGKDLAK